MNKFVIRLVLLAVIAMSVLLVILMGLIAVVFDMETNYNTQMQDASLVTEYLQKQYTQLLNRLQSDISLQTLSPEQVIQARQAEALYQVPWSVLIVAEDFLKPPYPEEATSSTPDVSRANRVLERLNQKIIEAETEEPQVPLLSGGENHTYIQLAEQLVRQGIQDDWIRIFGTQAEAMIKAARQYVLMTDNVLLFPILGDARISSLPGIRVNPVHGRKEIHKGIDFAANGGTPIVAAHSGKVTVASYRGSAGYMVAINGDEGLTTIYMHMRPQLMVQAGNAVMQGDIIGYVGSTGTSTGNHLHLEVWDYASLWNHITDVAPREHRGLKEPLELLTKQ